MKRGFVVVAAACAVLCSAGPARAYVGAPVGGAPGETTLTLRLTFERGLVEPNENQDSWQSARWNLYTIGGTHNLGDAGKLRDLTLGLDATVLTSPAERSERAPVASDLCLGTPLAGDRCEFYPDDTGGLVSGSVSANLIHDADLALGVFVQGTLPLGVNLHKFANPRVDYAAAGVTLGVRLRDWLGHDSRVYVGTGAFGAQNATVAVVQQFGVRGELAGAGLSFRAGSYFDGDLTERHDQRYDAAYTAGYPDTRDRVRMMRFGVLSSFSVGIADRYALELTYLQKLFGYDAPATQFWSLAGSVVF